MLNGIRTGVRADIFCAVVIFLQNRRYGFVFVARHADIAITFIVFEQDIVFRHMLLNQAAFEHQRFKFAVGYNIVKMVHVFDHFAHFDCVAVRRAEILADAVFERFCLADINNFILLVFHDIHAGQQR